MPDDIFDFSELRALSVDLGEAPVKMIPFVRKAVEFSAFEGRKTWRKYSKEHSVDGSLSGYSASIDYDLNLDMDGEISATIGPNLGRPQGSFGIVEDANGGVGGYARHDDEATAKAIEKDFVRGIEKAGLDALK